MNNNENSLKISKGKPETQSKHEIKVTTVGYAKMSDATRNKCYDDQFL